LALLILSSTYASFGHLANDFYVAINHCDILRLKYIAGHFILLVGKAIALHLAVDLLERAVSPLFSFFFSEHQLTTCHVAARFDRESQVICTGDNGDGRGRLMLTLTLMAAMYMYI